MALPRQDEDFPAWYQEVVRQAELAESSPPRGAMVIKPYGFAIWEAVQAALDARIKATGHRNAYFPLLIPHELLERESDHVEGFAPEVAVVTHAGGRELDQPLVVRPTSETTIWATFARWIQSYRDLPLLLNQWANVVRWELRPRLFLRTTEFLWQEGHTAHESEDEAVAEARTILLRVYRRVAEDVLAMPVLVGRKTPSERFAGAVETLTVEALMRDGKALQAGTSHYLGQNFSRAYGVRFVDRDGREREPHATSWGASTRLVGGLIMCHGDDRGLRLPPRLAPYQVVIVPISRDDDPRVADLVRRSLAELRRRRVRVHIDDREQHRPGFKFNEWELKGVPVRLELGPRDAEANQATLARRDGGDKQAVSLDQLGSVVRETLDDIQHGLRQAAEEFREVNTHHPRDFDELVATLLERGGFAVGRWCGSSDCEARVKEAAKATIRCLPLDPAPVDGACTVCGRPGVEEATWAQAY